MLYYDGRLIEQDRMVVQGKTWWNCVIEDVKNLGLFQEDAQHCE